MLSSWMQSAAVVSALLIHEAGHCLISALLGSAVGCIELTPFGGVITYQSGETPKKGWRGFAVAAAGPLANYLFLLCVSYIGISWRSLSELKPALITANLAMMLMNLLPVLPLDGGQMVFCAAYYLFPISSVISLLAFGGVFSGAAFILLAVYIWIQTSSLNLSLVIIGFYIMAAALRSKDAMITENAYAVIFEGKREKARIRKAKLYCVKEDTPILELLPYMEKAQSCVFMLTDDERCSSLQEEHIRRLMLNSPGLTMAQAVQKANNGFL